MSDRKKLTVLGGGESGVGAALLAAQIGIPVWLSDAGTMADRYRLELSGAAIPFEEGGHTWATIFDSAEVVKSPGIPDSAPLVRALQERGIPVISEIEFAARYSEAFVIGITGSNGKTTTTNLTHHLLATAGFDVVKAGNVGHSFARVLTERDPAYAVLELSSFQLDGIDRFRPDIGMLLNISPDHLDRYEYRMENYVASKFRIAMNQRAEDLLLVNADDPYIRARLKEQGVKARLIQLSQPPTEELAIEVDGHRFDLEASPLRGRHNFFNARCAVQTALLLGAAAERIQEGLNTFQNAPHRLEQVAEVDGVLFINDSKATNVDSVFYALDAMSRPVVWIAGGQDKGNDYTALLPLVEEKVKALVCLGADNARLREVFGGMVREICECRTAPEAVAQAAALASAGDVVLLSPACASFDLFRNYEQRGDLFRSAVLEHKRKIETGS